MNGELVKRQDRWDLYAEDGSKIGSSAPNPMNKLSLKNCQAIENDYDLDELAEQNWRIGLEEYMPTPATHVTSFKAGFQKALEILGDKKFSEKQMWNIFYFGDSLKNQIKSGKIENKHMGEIFDEYIQSLQQTEWDVEILTEKFFEVKGNDGIVIRAEAMECFGERNDYKLDADGCLILKRKVWGKKEYIG